MDECGGTAVETQSLAGVFEPVDDPGDVAQEDARAVRARENDHALEFVPPPRRAPGAQEDLALVRLDGPARQVQGALAQRGRHVVERQAVPGQRPFGDLHGDLVRPRVGEPRVGDARECEDVVSHAPAKFLQRALVHRRRDRDFGDHVVRRCELNDGPLRFPGERVDREDPVFDFRKGLRPVHVEEVFHLDRAQALRRKGADLLDAGDPAELFLDPRADVRLGFLRRGAEVGDRHDDQRQFEVRIQLDRDPLNGG